MKARRTLGMRCLALSALVLALALAVSACSVETRQERQDRLAQENGQQESGQQDMGSAQAAPSVQDSAETDTGSSDTGSSDTAASDTSSADAPATDAPASDNSQPADQSEAKPLGPALNALALQAPDQHPEAVVHAFFTQVMNGDPAALEPLVAQDQRQELKELLGYLEEQKNLPENALQGVDKVEIMRTTLSAVVDVNVTVRLENGSRTTAESIELVYEDGAWRLANLDF